MKYTETRAINIGELNISRKFQWNRSKIVRPTCLYITCNFVMALHEFSWRGDLTECTFVCHFQKWVWRVPVCVVIVQCKRWHQYRKWNIKGELCSIFYNYNLTLEDIKGELFFSKCVGTFSSLRRQMTIVRAFPRLKETAHLWNIYFSVSFK